jgi:hypothetical protein
MVSCFQQFYIQAPEAAQTEGETVEELEESDKMAQLNSSENSTLSLKQKDSVTRSIRECVSFCEKILVEEKSEARSV